MDETATPVPNGRIPLKGEMPHSEYIEWLIDHGKDIEWTEGSAHEVIGVLIDELDKERSRLLGYADMLGHDSDDDDDDES